MEEVSKFKFVLITLAIILFVISNVNATEVNAKYFYEHAYKSIEEYDVLWRYEYVANKI